MAKFIPGPFTAEVRNKLGGIVFTRGHHGPTTRAWVNPLQTPTIPRGWSRDTMADVSHRWNATLTDAQRAAWIRFGANNHQRARDFYRHNLTGQQWHTKLNFMLAWWGWPYLDNPPPDLKVSDPGRVTQFVIDRVGLKMWVNTQNWPVAPDVWYLYFTHPMNPGRMSNRQFYRQIAVIQPATPRPYNVWALYVSELGTPLAGQRVTMKAVGVRTTTGATTMPSYATALA